jgi:hypothetical protein
MRRVGTFEDRLMESIQYEKSREMFGWNEESQWAMGTISKG